MQAVKYSFHAEKTIFGDCYHGMILYSIIKENLTNFNPSLRRTGSFHRQHLAVYREFDGS